jgi:hypothetical protein
LIENRERKHHGYVTYHMYGCLAQIIELLRNYMPADVHLHQLRATYMPPFEDAELVQLQLRALAHPGGTAGLSAGALLGLC